MRYLSKLALLSGNNLTVFIHFCRMARKFGIKEFGFKNCDLATALGMSDNCVRKSISDLCRFGLIEQKKAQNANFVKLLHFDQQNKVNETKQAVKLTDEEWSKIVEKINKNLPLKLVKLDETIKSAITEWISLRSLDQLYHLLDESGRSRYIQEAGNMDILLCLKLADRTLRGDYSTTAASRKKKGSAKIDPDNTILSNLSF